jgi:chemotaxis protein MotB
MARRKKHSHHEEEHENEERWLVSFADMMTLLFCVFMVLFAISSVNTSKFEALQKSMKDAFSGAVLDGGSAMMQSGSSASENEMPSPEPPLPALKPITAINDTSAMTKAEKDAAARREEQEFRALKRRIDKLARQAGVRGQVKTTVRRHGLVVQLLTDKVFFDSGEAVLKPGARKLVGKIGAIVRDERRHPVVVAGHTDSQPIASSHFPSNWELSGARAGAVVRVFVGEGVLARRIALAGHGSQEPIATNSSPEGRSKNRRVEVVLTRINTDTES